MESLTAKTLRSPLRLVADIHNEQEQLLLRLSDFLGHCCIWSESEMGIHKGSPSYCAFKVYKPQRTIPSKEISGDGLNIYGVSHNGTEVEEMSEYMTLQVVS